MEKKEIFSGVTRRDFIYLSGLAVAGMTLAGVPEIGHGQEKKPKYGGRLRVGERYGSMGLDAHKNLHIMDCFNYLLMYNSLTIMGSLPEAKIYPDLAKSWEISADGREYIFALREGVKFHHGKELDTGDVKYSIERIINPATRSPQAFAFRWVDSIHSIDKYHLKIKLKEPFGPLLTALTIRSCPIIPAGWEPTGTKPAPGTGPFVLKSFVPNETTEFTRFDQYWEVDEKTGDHLPYLDSIYVKKIVDPTVRWTALRAGDVDYIPEPPRKEALEARKRPVPGIYMIFPEAIGNTWMFFNVSKPPFSNKKVRQAVASAIDKKELVQAAHWGLGEPINQPFLKRSWMYIPVKDREMDLIKAKQLLVEAGHAKGFETEFLQSSALPYDIAACEYVMGQIKKIGIEAKMKVVDRAAFTRYVIDGEYFITINSIGERMDPDDAYYMWLHSGEMGKNNWSRYSNKELDGLLENGRTTWKWEDRVPIYRKALEIIQEDVPILYLAKSVVPLVFRDYVKGFEGGASVWYGYYRGGMKNVWLDK